MGARAAFSACGHYRWWLERLWQPQAPRLLFIGLNLFARISSKPAGLRRCPDPVGSRCDAWIRRRWRDASRDCGPPGLWLGWGNGGAWWGRDREVLEMLALLAGPAFRPLCLGLTAAGQPRHSLHQRRSGKLQPFAPSWGENHPSAAAVQPCPALPVVTPFT